jgi:hypothetical protein
VIAGIDYSTHAVDVVLLDEDTDEATWHRKLLHGRDGFERAREVRLQVWLGSFWDDVTAIGIEDPRGYNAGALYRIQGAILACLPRTTLVQPLIPSVWRKTVGLPGNASKGLVHMHAMKMWNPGDYGLQLEIPQDACDAYCIALATRTLLVQGAAC